MIYHGSSDNLFIAGSRYAITALATSASVIKVNGRSFTVNQGTLSETFIAQVGFDRIEFDTTAVQSVTIHHIPVINTTEEYLTGEATGVFDVDVFGTKNLSPVNIPNYGFDKASVTYIGPWNTTHAYVVGNVVDYRHGDDIAYYQCLVASTNERPVSASNILSTKWRPLRNLNVVFNYGPPVPGGVDFVFSKVDYLNIAGHRRESYTEYEVVGHVVGKLQNVLSFPSHDGALSRWISSTAASVDIVPDSTADVRIPSIASALGFVARRNLPDTAYTAPKARQDSDPVYWSLALSTVSRRGASITGQKLPTLKCWPHTYNTVVDSASNKPLANEMQFQVVGQTTWWPVFDVFSPAWNQSTRYANNIILWQDHVAGKVEVISSNQVRVYDYPTNPMPGEILTIYVAGKYHRLTVDSVIVSPVYGKVITFDESAFFPSEPNVITILPADVSGAAHDVVTSLAIVGRRYSCKSSSSSTIEPILVQSDGKFRKVDGTFMQFFQGGETSYALTELTSEFGVIYRHTSGSHNFMVNCAMNDDPQTGRSYAALEAIGVIKHYTSAIDHTVAYSPVLDPAQFVFDLSGTDLKVTIDGVEYIVKCPDMSKTQVRDYLIANPRVMPRANDIIANYIVLDKRRRDGAVPAKAAGHMYVYLPIQGAIDGQECSLSFYLYNTHPISDGTGSTNGNIMPLAYVLSGGAADVADPFATRLSSFEAPITVGGLTLPSICTVEFPLNTEAVIPQASQLNCKGWNFIAGIYPYPTSSFPEVKAISESTDVHVEVKFVYSSSTGRWVCLDYQSRPMYAMYAESGTIAPAAVGTSEYQKALGEWSSTPYGKLSTMGAAMHGRHVTSGGFNPMDMLKHSYRVPWHNDLSVDWLNELCVDNYTPTTSITLADLVQSQGDASNTGYQEVVSNTVTVSGYGTPGLNDMFYVFGGSANDPYSFTQHVNGNSRLTIGIFDKQTWIGTFVNPRLIANDMLKTSFKSAKLRLTLSMINGKHTTVPNIQITARPVKTSWTTSVSGRYRNGVDLWQYGSTSDRSFGVGPNDVDFRPTVADVNDIDVNRDGQIPVAGVSQQIVFNSGAADAVESFRIFDIDITNALRTSYTTYGGHGIYLDADEFTMNRCLRIDLPETASFPAYPENKPYAIPHYINESLTYQILSFFSSTADVDDKYKPRLILEY